MTQATRKPSEPNQQVSATTVPRRLIINADDFGFNQEVTDGIVEAHVNGVVTSTTLMANMPAAEYAAERSRDLPNLSVGVHLNLTTGKPVSDPSSIPSLIGKDGHFLKMATFMSRANRFKLDAADLERELSAQFERCEALGIKPTHADSHHHAVFCMQPFFIKLRLLKKFGIDRIRTQRGWYRYDRAAENQSEVRMASLKFNLRRFPWRTYYEIQYWICKLRGLKSPTERFGFYKMIGNRKMDFVPECVPSLLATMPKGVNELACHPGYLSEDPLDDPGFRVHRTVELDLMTSAAFKSAISDAGVQLINYRQF